MNFRAAVLDIHSDKRAVIVHRLDAERMGIRLHDRLRLAYDHRTATALVELTSSLVSPGRIGLYRNLADELALGDGLEVEASVAGTPQSVSYIREKVAGRNLSKEKISAIVDDVVKQNLSELEIAAFLLGQEFHGMNMDEVEALARAMISSGTILEFPGVVVDKHSIGGIPGNKVSLLIVPMVASAGLLIPKTSSRAITSPAGTVDTMGILAHVEFTPDELRQIVLRVGGVIAWGGSLSLAPADDIFVMVEQPLRVDPRSQMLASIMAKKAAVGAQHLVLDIPTGRGAKATSMEEAKGLAADFVELGRRIGINVKCGITYGGQPIGRAVGPALEAKEALGALEEPDAASKSLVEKSVSLAGLLLEAGGAASRGRGREAAMEILKSGKALKKFREIIEAQGGDPSVRAEDLKKGDHVHQIFAESDGYVTLVDNEAITSIARASGAPIEKAAGVLLRAKQGHKVNKGEVIMEIYAERATKLAEAVSLCERMTPMVVEGMLLSTMPQF